MCSHPVYPRKTTDCPSRHFHGFPDTHATNGRATQIWHTRTENTGTMRESKLAFKKKGKKYDRTDSTDHTPYENRGLSAGIRTVDAMHRFHYEGYRRLQGCNKDVSQTQSRHLFRSRGRWRKNHWRDSCRPRRKTVAHLHTAVDPTRAVGALARCWWAVWLKRFVRSACRKSPSVCPQTTMPATISGSIRGLRSVTIWSIGNYLSNTSRPTTNRPIRSHFVSISPVPHLQPATNMFCISNVFKDHAMEYQTEEDPFGALKRDELL